MIKSTSKAGSGPRTQTPQQRAMHSEQPKKENLPAVPAEAVAPRSKPVAVPAKNRFRDTSVEHITAASTNAGASGRRTSRRAHDPTSISPSVAALLSVTSIPRKKSFTARRQSSSVPQRMSTQQLMDQWDQEHVGSEKSLSSSPGLDALLSPPDIDEHFSRSGSVESMDEFTRSRTSSYESTPSLGADDRLSLSWNLPDTPAGLVRKSSRGKLVKPSRSIESSEEHPLTAVDDGPSEEYEPSEDDNEGNRTPVMQRGSHQPENGTRRPSTFKSNLTASLSALRSSLRSLSNFATTPYSLPEDHISQGLFSGTQLIQREMRPRFLDAPPTPGLRRYLNPSAYSRSVPNDFHLHGSRFEHDSFGHVGSSLKAADAPSEGSLIALQDRLPSDASASLSARAASKGRLSEAGRAMVEGKEQYRRELRENGEFLRVCVLETNMRRAGKFEGPGRARVWLAARTVDGGRQGDATVVDAEGRMIPRRWIGTVA